MRILFCNIAWMDYYKGIIPGVDVPKNGGSYVSVTGDAHEAFNFLPVDISFTNGEYPAGMYCLGFVETKSTNRSDRNELHIEKIAGCETLTKENTVEDVLVVYCAKYPFAEKNETYVVGWYQHATVYRYYACTTFPLEDGGEEEQYYNALALAENCVLLPRNKRRNPSMWRVPRMSEGRGFGLGQANVWFASDREENKALVDWLTALEHRILTYDGENDLYREIDFI